MKMTHFRQVGQWTLSQYIQYDTCIHVQPNTIEEEEKAKQKISKRTTTARRQSNLRFLWVRVGQSTYIYEQHTQPTKLYSNIPITFNLV